MRARKGSFNVGDTAEAASGPPDEGGPSDGLLAKERRGECPVEVGAWQDCGMVEASLQAFSAPLSPSLDAPFCRWAWTPGAQVMANLHPRLRWQSGPQPWLR